MPDITKTLQRTTPFITPINTTGGTFYTFSSAAEDLTLSFNTDTPNKFRFSKFALLNIPDFLTSDPVLNTVRLKAIPGAFEHVDFRRTTKLNHFFAESFQNYCLNLETMILSDQNYNPRNPRTVSERVFFKWLKELGALRFNKQNVQGLNDIRFTEEQDSANVYNRVVQYIGDIDFVNNLSTQVNSYSEVYVHIPTEVGNFSNVYFKSIIDSDNYAPTMSFSRLLDGNDNSFISGRHYNDYSPAGLDTHAYYDQANTTNNLYQQYKRKTTATNFVIPGDYELNEWWHYLNTNINTYYLEPNIFDDTTNDDLAIVDYGASNIDQSAIKFRRSRLDGISIDFDYNSYKNLSEGQILSLLDVAQNTSSADFEFNAILIYYDLYEDIVNVTTNSTTTGTYPLIDPEEVATAISSGSSSVTLATNLFGVLFLDNVEDNLSLSGGYIPRFKKVRPNTVTKLNGNAYGFKINMKLDVSSISSGVEVETVISNSNTLSMDIYSDALNSLYKAAEKMSSMTFNTLGVDNRIIVLENWIKQFDPSTITGIANRLNTLEILLKNTGTLTNEIPNNALVTLQNLIDTNYRTVLDILNGKTPISVSHDLGTFVQGVGINLDKSNPNRLVISSNNNNFNFQEKKEVSIYSDWNLVPQYLKGTKLAYTYEVDLKPLKNYLRITDNSEFIPNKDIVLYIKDDQMQWEIGQTFRVYFTNPILMKNFIGNFNFYIYSDYLNRTRNSDKYSQLITKITSSIFESKNFRPVIEIICKDPGTFDFFIDYLN